MIAVAIIAVLVAIGAVVYVDIQKKSRDARRLSDLRAIQNAAETYYAENTAYPPDAATLAIRLESRIFPRDPRFTVTTDNYQYKVSDGGFNTTGGTCIDDTTIIGAINCYTVCAKLEQTGKGNASDMDGTVASGGQYFCARARQ